MTPDQLDRATGCGTVLAQKYAAPLTAAMTWAVITTPERQAAFLAQVAHESTLFARVEEGLRYTTSARLLAVFPGYFKTAQQAVPYLGNAQALANHVYANRLGNGSEASGDGWRYRGRGLIQLTGRDNYQAFGDAIGEPIATEPDLVATPGYAALSAAWFWRRTGCNALADAGQIDRITKRINGPAMLGAAERRALYKRALAVLKT